MVLTESKTLQDYLLNEYDVDKFHATVAVLQSESGYPDLTSHLRSWAKNKEHIFRMFGNKLKIEAPVTSSISKNSAHNLICNFINEHLDTTQAVLAKTFLKERVETKEIIDNSLNEDKVFFGSKFSKGMKISRILGKLVPSSLAHKVQTAFSMLVQTFTVQGTAVISIDPIDYITMSESRSGWRSCHALDGEYRTGTLAYLMDVPTAIAYITTSKYESTAHVKGKETKIDFDNKMWRQVVLFSDQDSAEQYAIQSRQYPNTSTNNSNAIAQLVRNALSTTVESGNLFAEDFAPFITERVEVDAISEIVHDKDSDHLWYNDITHGAFGSARLTFPSQYENAEHFLDENTFNDIYVGVNGIKCACGCGSYLDHSEYLYVESEYEDEHDEDYHEED